MNTKSKTIVGLIIIVMVTWATTSPGCTENEEVASSTSTLAVKHYSGKGVSFDYPAEWKLTSDWGGVEKIPGMSEEVYGEMAEMAQALRKQGFTFIAIGNEETEWQDYVTITIAKTREYSMSRQDYQEMAEYLDKRCSEAFPDFEKISNRIVTLTGRTALDYVFVYRDPNLVYKREIFIVEKGTAYSIVCTARRPDFRNFDEKYFEPIISNFNIIDEK